MTETNPQVITTQTEQKTFKYQKGDTNLSFTLRTDIITELKDFKELLKVALIEVEAELSKWK